MDSCEELAVEPCWTRVKVQICDNAYEFVVWQSDPIPDLVDYVATRITAYDKQSQLFTIRRSVFRGALCHGPTF